MNNLNLKIAALAALVAVTGTIASALAAETGFGPVQLIQAQTIDDPPGACENADRSAGITRDWEPTYPEFALGEGVEGVSTVTFTMALDGAVSNATLANASGNHMLDQAAVEAVRNSRFTPEIHNCAKIAGIYDVPVFFSLSDNEADWQNLLVGSGTVVRK